MADEEVFDGDYAEDTQEELDALEDHTSDQPYDLLRKFHPETVLDYAETILPSVPLQVAPAGSTALDAKHTSLPFLTTYERTKILGTRANQIADGARPFITVPEYMTQPLEIAKLELEQRRLPFIIKRPMPDGTFEYWRLSDLMII
jgi:DNA-directed RNA polymerases I, II, and III subunit RPABC2